MRLINLNDAMKDDLQNPEFAAAYLEECLAFNEPEVFLAALRDVVQANMPVSTMAKEIEVDRARLYTSLSENGNPGYQTITAILNRLGLRLSVVPAEHQKAA